MHGGERGGGAAGEETGLRQSAGAEAGQEHGGREARGTLQEEPLVQASGMGMRVSDAISTTMLNPPALGCTAPPMSASCRPFRWLVVFSWRAFGYHMRFVSVSLACMHLSLVACVC